MKTTQFLAVSPHQALNNLVLHVEEILHMLLTFQEVPQSRTEVNQSLLKDLRGEVRSSLMMVPYFETFLDEKLPSLYDNARTRLQDAGITLQYYPRTCPFTLGHLLGRLY